MKCICYRVLNCTVQKVQLFNTYFCLLNHKRKEIICIQKLFKNQVMFDMFCYYFKLIIFHIHLNNVFNIITAVKLEDTGQENMTLLWQNGVISNYEYLLYLNRWNILRMSLIFLFIILKFKNYQKRIYKLCHKLTFRLCIISNSLM